MQARNSTTILAVAKTTEQPPNWGSNEMYSEYLEKDYRYVVYK